MHALYLPFIDRSTVSMYRELVCWCVCVCTRHTPSFTLALLALPRRSLEYGNPIAQTKHTHHSDSSAPRIHFKRGVVCVELKRHTTLAPNSSLESRCHTARRRFVRSSFAFLFGAHFSSLKYEQQQQPHTPSARRIEEAHWLHKTHTALTWWILLGISH